MKYLKSYDKLILDHYKKVAKNSGLSSSSTIEDPFIRESEIDFIVREITRFKKRRKRPIRIMDIGSGNGYLLSVLKEKFNEDSFFGVEFCKELYQLSLKRDLKGVMIFQGDCRQSDFFNEVVDIVITERVVINILNRPDQLEAVANIYNILKKSGLYIMIESFRESFDELNYARSEMSLKEISRSPQNRYLNESFVEKIKKYGFSETRGLMPKNFLSSHFYLTRVFHKHIRPTGGRLKGSRFVNFFREALPSSIGNYSPIQFRVFKKDLKK